MADRVTPDAVVAALALPKAAFKPQRVAKALLLDTVAQASDRKLIETRVERLQWEATLNPATIGVPALSDGERDVPAIQLFRLDVRAEPGVRLPLLIHRAVPVPVVLVTSWPAKNHGDGPVRVTLAPLRRAERVEARVVERVVAAPDLAERGDPATAAFLASLALPGLPRGDLHALYEGLVARAEALAAARATGGALRLLTGPAEIARRREALAVWGEAAAEAERLAAAARAEKRLAQAVGLGEAARAARTRAAALAEATA